jgi:hypothetical protein
VRPRPRWSARLGWAAVLAGLAGLAGLLYVLQRPSPPPPAPTRPRTYFVAAAARPGGDGSAARPYAAIQPAIDAAGPGDTVRVGPGDYPGSVHTVRSGTAQQRIRLSGDGARIVPGTTGSGRLVEIDHDYLDVTGFTVDGGSTGIRLDGAHHVRVLHNVVRDALGECVRVKNQSTGNEVAFNAVSDCGREHFDLAADRKNGEGIYIGTAPEQLGRNPGGRPDHSDGNWIHDNTIDTPAECVDVKESSRRDLVEHNTCRGGRDPDSAGMSGRGDYLVFRGNTVIGELGAGIRLGGDRPGQGVHSVVVDNDLQNPHGYGVKVMRTPQDEICGNGVIDAGLGPSNLAATHPSAACPS